MIQTKEKILFVEDDPVLGYAVKHYLETQNYDVTHCIDGATAWNYFMKNVYDVCLLDVIVPGKDGLELSNSIRKKNTQIPIIILSSNKTDGDKIAGFAQGADGYMTKPYNLKELNMRIGVFLKRRLKNKYAEQVCFKIGNLKFDYINLAISDNNNSIFHQLTQREADVLRYFCLNANRIIPRDELLIKLWGKDDYFLGRSMDVFITKIRKYLKEQVDANIETIHGKGFIFIYDGQM